ncbi:hypothetical protein M409DRAFT_23630 [Zasmidium cellare ATCC 36951]|uniref:ZZ-type domain-containing protein n=1 Tax=Zasmidium cellare ATCC 36951 TaxID=1080233 RepID=A0A6A6CI89_ZASCE|nr:uncharacterized protein M409DRAFT_23630 [Zasmidium cellare ATCC 36951]KAF2165898.1 hypothetical protein M409DRAFT_23630 [Zasmidium cellare ATCC 36951]
MTLTSATLKSFMSGIKDSKLPRTFKDAIMLTRNLRFRYIWIDSMCIIQPTGPSNDDWNREAARMGGYYSNSRLNLAASAGMGNAEPLLRVRMGSMIEARPFPLFEQAVHRKWTGMSEIMKRDPMWLPSVQPSIPSWLHHIQDSPLSSRAWVLQERLLAPRTLHCTMQGFMWECSELRATEYEPLGTSSDFVARDHGLLNVNVIGRREKDFIVGTYWRQVVEAFSQLQISFPSDRLPALAGIASKVQEYTDDIYIAGHFESSLLGSLLWSTLRPVTPVKVTRNAGAPSWAWASTSAPVTFASLDATDYPSRNPERIEWEAEIIDVSAQPASRQNPFSWLSLGALRIRGRLKEWKSGEDVAEIRLQDQTAEGRWWGHRPMPDGNVNQAGAIPVKRRESLVELQGPQSADSEVSKRRCDGCEKDIRGGFSSCLICPDFDYCSDCMLNASATHPEHSFKTYESDRARTAAVVASGDLLTATIEKQMTQARRTMEQIKLEEQRLESGRNHNPTIDVTLDWPDEFVAGATMYLFLIIRGIQEPSWEGLVLAPTENGRDFRRLGYFSTKASAVFQDVEIQQISLT